jgi:PAS domain S-box-containing protein
VISRAGAVLGGLLFGHPKPGVFTERDERLAVGIAAQAAVALERARLCQQVKAEAQLCRGLQGVFNHALEAILLADDEGRYIDANPTACTLTGYDRDELLRSTVWDLTPGLQRERGQQLWRTFLTSGSQQGEYTLCHRDGSLVEVEYRAVANIVPGSHLSVLRDITERKRAEARQRLLAEAGAILAASFDYPAILDSLARCIVPSLADWCVIDMLEEDGWVARLALAHKDPRKEGLLQELKRRYPRLHSGATHTLLRVLRTRQPWLRRELPEAQGRAEARDPQHWEILQALGFVSEMIVPLSARGRVLGTITFILGPGDRRYGPDDLALAEDLARRCALTIDNARLYSEMHEATVAKEESLALLDTLLTSAPIGVGFLAREFRYVRLNQALADINSVPIAARLGRTPHGIGTGLGLSLCRGIVEGHGGTMSVQSQPGQGTVFSVELPVESGGSAMSDFPGDDAHSSNSARTATILVIDDEPGIASALVHVLSRSGHTVETAANGRLALAKLAERAFDLILCDLRMPELDGPGFYQELARHYPQLLPRIIFLTGDTLSPEARAFLEKVGGARLHKPFRAAQVRQIVHQALQAL